MKCVRVHRFVMALYKTPFFSLHVNMLWFNPLDAISIIIIIIIFMLYVYLTNFVITISCCCYWFHFCVYCHCYHTARYIKRTWVTHAYNDCQFGAWESFHVNVWVYVKIGKFYYQFNKCSSYLCVWRKKCLFRFLYSSFYFIYEKKTLYLVMVELAFDCIDTYFTVAVLHRSHY